MKDRMDAFDIFAIVKELKKFENGHIEKVYQEGDEIFLKISKNGRHDIFIKNERWICITKHRKDIEKPPDFAMVLRKYIGRGKILKIKQYDFDRIVIFEIQKESRYRLIIELIPNGNVILIDENGTIINALLRQQWKHRTIRPGEKYSFPPSRKNPFEINYEDFKEAFTEKDAVRSIVKIGIPGKWAEEICSIAGIDKKTPSDRLEEKHIRMLYEAMKDLLKKFEEGNFKPVIIDGDVLPFPLSRYEGKEATFFDSVNEAFDEFYFRYIARKEKNELEKEKERMKRQLKMQEEAIKKFVEDAERFKREGDAIFSNFEKVDEMIKNKDFIEKKYPKAIIELPYGKEKMIIEIDIRKNAIENAQEKYEASKKMREKARKAKEAMKDVMKKIKKLTPKEKVEKEKEKKFWFEGYRWFISSDGNIVIGGKDAKSNEKVVKKYLKDDDIYVHADIHGAPSCIIKASDINGKKIGISEQTLKEACQFAVIYSKAWRQFGKASAYWVYPQQVSKTPPPGEYLPRGAFMVRGKRNYMEVVMEIAIGIVEIKGQKKIMGGPPSAVKKWAEKWVVFEPGEKDKNEVAKEIAKLFDTRVEKVLQALPGGGLRRKEEKL